MSKKLNKKQMKTAKGGASNDPLIVIDGITVLKDAHASAVYGSRGQNGVILITTPKKDSKALGAQAAASEDLIK